MTYPITELRSIRYCPLCGESVPDFDYQESQQDWKIKHCLVSMIVEVVLPDDDYQSSDDEPCQGSLFELYISLNFIVTFERSQYEIIYCTRW